MSTYSIKSPDMSRNIALAGMTVSTRGMNVTYNERGYAVKATNYGHEFFAATSRSICAPSKEAVLTGASRTGYDGPDEDRMHFSDQEFARAVKLRNQVAAGQLSEWEANKQLEEIRRMYGYSFGTSGTQYAKIELPYERPEDIARAQARQSVAAQEGASVQSDAPRQDTSAQSAAPQQDARSETEQLRDSCQTQLREQQQRQTVYSELEELRVKNMIRVNGKERVSDALLELMDEDEDD